MYSGGLVYLRVESFCLKKQGARSAPERTRVDLAYVLAARIPEPAAAIERAV